MRKWYNIPAILVVMVILIGTVASACAQQAPAPPKQTGPIVINVGLPTPLSGPAAPWGQAGGEPYGVFIDLINKDGFKVGDNAYNFKLIQVDDENTPEGGAAAAKELIFGNNCKFLGGYWSWGYPAVSSVTNSAKAIFICRTGNEAVPGGVYDPKTQPYTVFGNPSHEEYISDCKAIAKGFPNYKGIGILDSTLGKGVGWDYVDKELDATGIRYHHEWVPPGTMDMTPYIAKYADAKCDMIFSAGDVTLAMLMAKQRWEMGYKDWHVGHSGSLVDPAIYIAVCGYDAVQGFIAAYDTPTVFKETKADPKITAMVQQVMDKMSQKKGKPYEYVGWVAWLPSHLQILQQAMQKAGTVDDTDAIMKAIRGGSFDTTAGSFTMSGAKTYGSPIVYGTAGVLCTLQGEKQVYLSESPWKPLP